MVIAKVLIYYWIMFGLGFDSRQLHKGARLKTYIPPFMGSGEVLPKAKEKGISNLKTLCTQTHCSVGIHCNCQFRDFYPGYSENRGWGYISCDSHYTGLTGFDSMLEGNKRLSGTTNGENNLRLAA